MLLLDNTASEIIVIEHNILFWKYKPDNYVTLTDFMEMHAVSKQYVKKNEKCYFIVEAPFSMNFEVDMWKFVSENNYEDDIAIGIALYTSGTQHKIMRKAYERKVTPEVIFNVLPDFDEALNWIKNLSLKGRT